MTLSNCCLKLNNDNKIMILENYTYDFIEILSKAKYVKFDWIYKSNLERFNTTYINGDNLREATYKLISTINWHFSRLNTYKHSNIFVINKFEYRNTSEASDYRLYYKIANKNDDFPNIFI